jgi:hypothetical protein
MQQVLIGLMVVSHIPFLSNSISTRKQRVLTGILILFFVSFVGEVITPPRASTFQGKEGVHRVQLPVVGVHTEKERRHKKPSLVTMVYFEDSHFCDPQV